MSFEKGAAVVILGEKTTGIIAKVLGEGKYLVSQRIPLINKKTGFPVTTLYGRQSFSVEKRELDESQLKLHQGAGLGDAQSKKGLLTLEQMGVELASVTKVWIDYKVEIRPYYLKRACKACNGTGHISVLSSEASDKGIEIKNSKFLRSSSAISDTDGNVLYPYSYSPGAPDRSLLSVIRCPKGCEEMRCVEGYDLKSRVYAIAGWEDCQVTVAYPRWSEGVIFDARFDHSGNNVQ
ncbi:MAG: hypothetical protein EOP06_02630, partial [Proteobacteria bacterium]